MESPHHPCYYLSVFCTDSKKNGWRNVDFSQVDSLQEETKETALHLEVEQESSGLKGKA